MATWYAPRGVCPPEQPLVGARGEDAAKLVRDEAERCLTELERRREDKLRAFEGLGVVRPGPVSYVGTALVAPVVGEGEEVMRPTREDPEVELAAMPRAETFERELAREVEGVVRGGA